MAAMQEGSTELELRAFQMWITGEISSLRKTGVTGEEGGARWVGGRAGRERLLLV